MNIEEEREKVANRLQLIIDALENGNKPAFLNKTGIDRMQFNNSLAARRQWISIPNTILIKRAYRIPLDWIYDGDRDGLPRELQDAIDDAIAKGVAL